MDHFELELRAATATNTFGRLLGQAAQPGDIICLYGDLGCGKTTLTQAIAAGIPIDENYFVGSPSFAIFHEYPGRIPLYHMDFYRLYGSDDVLELGLDDYFFREGLTVIEWGERAMDILPEERLDIAMKRIDDHSRRAVCTSSAMSWKERMRTLFKTFGKMA